MRSQQPTTSARAGIWRMATWRTTEWWLRAICAWSFAKSYKDFFVCVCDFVIVFVYRWVLKDNRRRRASFNRLQLSWLMMRNRSALKKKQACVHAGDKRIWWINEWIYKYIQRSDCCEQELGGTVHVKDVAKQTAETQGFRGASYVALPHLASDYGIYKATNVKDNNITNNNKEAGHKTVVRTLLA